MRDECEAITSRDPALQALGRSIAILLPDPDGEPILLHDAGAGAAARGALGRLRLGAPPGWPRAPLGPHLDARPLLAGVEAPIRVARPAERGGLLVLAAWDEGLASTAIGAAFDALDRALRRHAARAATTRQVASSRPSPFEEVFENAAHCMLVIGADRRVLAANRAGRRVLREGRLLVEAGGRLRAADAREDRRLAAALGDDGARREAPCAVVLAGATGGTGLRCEIGRIGLRLAGEGPRFLVTATPIAAGAPVEALLSEAFGLTRAEARLAGELAAGRDLRAAGERMGVSHHTARKYLQIAFSKMGVRRQADLVRLALQLAHDPAAASAA